MTTAKAGLRERKRQENRQAILSAARDCFREQGFERTTIRDIIQRTDLAAGTFYNYFEHKEDVFAALLQRFLDLLNDEIRHLRAQARNEREFVMETYRAFFQATAEDPVIYQLAHRNDAVISELFGYGIREVAIQQLQVDLEAAALRGLFCEPDRRMLTGAFFGVAWELSLLVAERALEAPDEAHKHAEQAADFATRLFLQGMGSQSQ